MGRKTKWLIASSVVLPWLIAAGIIGCDNPNAKDKDGYTRVQLAALTLDQAAAADLLNRGADPNLHDSNPDRETALELALRSNYPGSKEDMLRLLLAKGADPNLADKDGDTPLHRAAKNGWKDAAALLLDKGANPNAANSAKETPLHVALENERVDIANLLLSKGADIHINRPYS